jgi:hypothetical protein
MAELDTTKKTEVKTGSTLPQKTDKQLKLEEKKAKLLEQLEELDRKEKRINWTQDDKRKHTNHLKMMLSGEVIKAAKDDEKLKEKLIKILQVSKVAVKAKDKKLVYDEIIALFK